MDSVASVARFLKGLARWRGCHSLDSKGHKKSVVRMASSTILSQRLGGESVSERRGRPYNAGLSSSAIACSSG